MNLLDFFAEQSAGYLHGGGIIATKQLLSQLNLKGQEKVLEVGIGTGTSLVAMCSKFPQIDLKGIDINPLMLQRSNQRLQFCGLPNVPLFKVEPQQSYPFLDASFDIILVESVLAIQSIEQIQWMLGEFSRLLKSGGLLALNETIWLPNQNALKLQAFNNYCLKNFGIIQANDQLLDVNAWKKLMQDSNWKIQYCEKVIKGKKEISFNKKLYLSRLFTLWGSFKAKLNSSHSKKARNIKAMEKKLQDENSCKMCAYIFVLKKI